MYIPKQAEQKLYLTAQKSNNGVLPLPTHSTSQAWVGALPISVVCWIGPDEV